MGKTAFGHCKGTAWVGLGRVGGMGWGGTGREVCKLLCITLAPLGHRHSKQFLTHTCRDVKGKTNALVRLVT